MDENLPDPMDLPEIELWDEREAFAGGKLRRIPQARQSRREKALEDVQEVFELIGGTPRFAAWANENQGYFYSKIYIKTLPNPNVQVNIQNNMAIAYSPAIPPSPLDNPTDAPTPPPPLPPEGPTPYDG